MVSPGSGYKGMGRWLVSILRNVICFGYFTGLCIAVILTDMVSLCPDQLQRSSSSETGLWGRVQYDP